MKTRTMTKMLALVCSLALLLAAGSTAAFAGWTDSQWLTAEVNADLRDYTRVGFDSASASSELGNFYKAWKAMDGDLSSSWQEAGPGYGIGETLTLYFEEQETIDVITIWPGYKPYYTQNGRPSVIKLTFSDGTCYYVELKDKNQEQVIFLPSPVTTDRVTIRLEEVYPGTNCEDTCITEVRAYSNTRRQSAVNGTMLLTAGQISQIRRDLWIPDSANVVCCVASQPVYWEAAKLWVVYCQFLERGTFVAGAYVVLNTGELATEICFYQAP